MNSSIRVGFVGVLSLFVLFGPNTVVAMQRLDVPITPEGIISSFSASCSGTNATAVLITGYPFISFVGEYMRRPCVEGIVSFDSYNLNEYLEIQAGGGYDIWFSYFKPPFQLVVKDTTTLSAPDAPIYRQIVYMANESNGYDRSLLSPLNNTYPTLVAGSSFDFNGESWFKTPPLPNPLSPEPIGDPNNLSASISRTGYVPRVSINCTIGHNYTLSLVHREGDLVTYSFGVKQREYCKDGIVSFDGFDISSLFTTRVDPEWWRYIRTPIEYIIKDTTGIYECDIYHCPLINLAGGFNNYNTEAYLASSTTWTTVGRGPVYDVDETHTIWSNTNNILVKTGNSNVLFIPGLQASRLYKNTAPECTFINCEDQLWEPNTNGDVEDLYLDENGESVKPNIYTKDIIKETNTPFSTGLSGQNIYKSFSNMMDGLVSDNKIQSWKAYPYDWRKSVDDVVNTAQRLEDGKYITLVDTLEKLVASSTNGKVTLIAHSNGGLIAKALLKKLQNDKVAGRNNLIDSVDVLILVAVPEIGTAKAVPAMLHGYDSQILLGWLMSETRARELGRNMPSAYGLLPSLEYINHISASPVTFMDTVSPSNVTTSFVQNYGSAINSYLEYKDFLFGAEGRTNPVVGQTFLPVNLSQSLFAKAETLHNQIDNFVPPASLRVIEIAGWGLDTLASFEYYPRVVGCSGQGVGCVSYVLDQRPRFTIDGDKTVVVPSAHYMSYQGNAEKYWVDLSSYNKFHISKISHSSIFEINSLLDMLYNVFQNITIQDYNYISSTLPMNLKSILRLSIHSPVTLDAYDSEGNHTGKVCPDNSDFCYVEEEILNSSYLEFGEGKYINLPEEEFSKIKLQGTGVGTFTYESERVLPNGSTDTLAFVDIPVTTQSQAEITMSTSTGAVELKLDVGGDGVVDFTFSPSSEFDPILYLQIMKETINSLDINQSKKNTFSKRVDNVIKSIQKGKIDKGKLIIEEFTKKLEKRLEKSDSKKQKSKKLSKTDAQLLLDMLNELLDNLR